MEYERLEPRLSPYRVVSLYMLLSMAWIVLGDLALARWVRDPVEIAQWKSYGGYALVLVSGLFGVWLLQRIQRDDAVRASALEDRELILRYAPAGIARVRVGGQIEWANSQLGRMLGMSPQALCGQNFRDWVFPANREVEGPQVDRLLERLWAGEMGFYQGERRCRMHGSAHTTPVLSTVMLAPGAGHREPALICVLQDMSEIEAAHQALAHHKTRLKLALDGSGAGMWDWDLRERVGTLSATLRRMLHYPEAQWPRSLRLMRRIHPEDRRETHEKVKKALATGEPFSHTLRLLCFDGIYRWFHARGMRHLSAGGAVERFSGILFDQTAQRLQEERQRLAATVVDNTIEGVVVTDAHSRILSVNASFTRLLGFTEEEMLGQTPRMFKSGRHDQAFYEAMWASMRRTGHWQGEIWNRRKDGEIFPERMSLSAVYDAAGNVTHYVCMFTDISEEKSQQQRLDYLARKDALTGLDNRSWFGYRLGKVLDAAKGSRKLAVMLINIDRFRAVNDSYGHAIGDQVLCHVAARLQAALRPEDLIGRMAGDEVAVAIMDIASEADAAHVAQQLVEAVAQPWHAPDGVGVVPSVSVGVCLYPQQADTVDGLLQGAHSAVYAAKQHNGPEAWCFFQKDMTDAARERLELEARLRQALADGHMRLHYQPQVDIATGCVTGAEALVRWLDPVEGLISPGRFIPVAESSGVIGPLGEWVLREACAQGQRWRAMGLPEITLAVNVSQHQFLLTDIVGSTAAALADAGFPAECLELEITESALTQKPEEALQVLRNLRGMGLRLAIDDFGTGYSSLMHLKRFPIDVLKIDQGFVSDIPYSADDMAISAAVIAMGHSMGLTVLAEGVETPEQLEFLRERGCNHFQGYLCSRPLPADAFEDFLRRSAQGPVMAAPQAGA